MTIEWDKRWAEGRIGFHLSDVHPDLVAHQTNVLLAAKRVLVPLCGKSLDLEWLVEKGYQVVGVELVREAVDQFFSESSLEPIVDELDHFVRYTSGQLTMLCGDVFDITSELVGPIDAIWDRAALVALPDDRRGAYVELLRTLCSDGVVLQNSFTYDQSLMPGPPFSVAQEEVRQLYNGARVEVLDEKDAVAVIPWQDVGHQYFTVTTYAITLSA